MGLIGDKPQFSDPDKNPLAPEENVIVEKVARKVVEKGMTVPAILFLESVKPLNFIGSQTLVFFEPIVQTLFNFKDYNTFQTALEKRESIEVLLLKIEEFDAVEHRRQKAIKKYIKKEKKNWKWYQRWLGIATPKIELTEEDINPPPPEKPSDQFPPK